MHARSSPDRASADARTFGSTTPRARRRRRSTGPGPGAKTRSRRQRPPFTGRIRSNDRKRPRTRHDVHHCMPRLDFALLAPATRLVNGPANQGSGWWCWCMRAAFGSRFLPLLDKTMLPADGLFAFLLLFVFYGFK